VALALVPDDLRARVENRCLARQCRSSLLHVVQTRADLTTLPEDRDRIPAVLHLLRQPPRREGPDSPDSWAHPASIH
jgi:hypothetical protein